MSIGIGVTTYKRPKIKALWLENYLKYTQGDNIKLYIAEDTDLDRKGIAARKNECLRALKDCDFIFLFDDDCYPIKKGWMDFFIYSGFKHLLYLNNEHNALGFNGDGIVYADCGGVFMFMTKECIDSVGAFDEGYGMYGFEHADYSIRIHKAGITVHKYTSLIDTHKYLYSLDYADINTSSISDEEKQMHVKNNWDKFFNQQKKTYISL